MHILDNILNFGMLGQIVHASFTVFQTVQIKFIFVTTANNEESLCQSAEVTIFS
jgi:hypothetical protein